MIQQAHISFVILKIIKYIKFSKEKLRERYINISASYFFFLIFIYFLAALGLRCSVRAFSSCGERGLLFVVAHGLLIVVASLVVEHGL